MALTTALAVGSLAVGAYSANKQAGAAKSAGRAASASADAATREQQRQFDLIRQDQAPYQQIGTGALNKLASLYGITSPASAASQAPTAQPMSFDQWQAANPSTGDYGGNPFGARGRYAQAFDARDQRRQQDGYQQYLGDFAAQQDQQRAMTQPVPGAPDYSEFYNSPDYQFALEQGYQGLNRAAAAGGNLASGNTLAAAQQYGQGLATQNYGNYVNRLAGLAGIGQTANAATGQAGLQTGANIGNSLMAAGNARASGITDASNAWGNFAGGVAGFGGQLAGNYLMRQQMGRVATPGFSTIGVDMIQ